MKLFRVYNGWTGSCGVHRVVVADTEQEAVDKVKFLGIKKWDDLEAEHIDMEDGVEGGDGYSG